MLGDSDDEFEIPEPLLPQTELQKAKVAAWSTFETVRQRWEAEKKHQRTAKREAGRIARLQQKRTERQRALLSTLSAVQRDDNVENVAMDDSSSSVSASSSSPTKRKFNAAAVVGVYTTYMTQAVIAQAQLAADLRQAMREECNRAQPATVRRTYSTLSTREVSNRNEHKHSENERE